MCLSSAIRWVTIVHDSCALCWWRDLGAATLRLTSKSLSTPSLNSVGWLVNDKEVQEVFWALRRNRLQEAFPSSMKVTVTGLPSRKTNNLIYYRHERTRRLADSPWSCLSTSVLLFTGCLFPLHLIPSHHHLHQGSLFFPFTPKNKPVRDSTGGWRQHSCLCYYLK